MSARKVSLAVVCTGFALAGAHVAHAQEATSANLPDQFQTGEMIQIQKPKRKKAEANSQSLATRTKQNTATVPEQISPAQELPTILATGEKKVGSSRSPAATTPSQTTAPPIQQSVPPEESAPAVVPIENKPRPQRRPRPAVQPEMASIAAPVPMSLSVAQSMAISAPLPEYTYEAKRRNLTGNGTCVVTVDVATGRVTEARMFQSTGSQMLDKLTIQTFKSWRFKPGTVSQVRVPISYQ